MINCNLCLGITIVILQDLGKSSRRKGRLIFMNKISLLSKQMKINSFREDLITRREIDMIIKKDNQILLDKLVEISHGKWVRLYF